MTTRQLLSLSIASCAIIAAAPALAQPEMTYEPGQYDYARPAPVQPPVIYQQQPVIQPVPMPSVSQPVVQAIPEGYEDEGSYEIEEVYTPAPHSYHAQPYPMHHAGPPMPPQPAFDREAWLDQCRDQYRDYRGSSGRREGGIGGGILGAAVGGVIGNRVADGDRLAGTLIGAGVGGIAGAVLGSVIGGAGDRRRDARAVDECEAWLDRYMVGGYGQGHGYPGYGYGYGYAMHMTYVPVLIAIPQRAVVRETVTEEWVEVEHSHTRPAKTVHHRPAPAPAPRPIKTKYAKQR